MPPGLRLLLTRMRTLPWARLSMVVAWPYSQGRDRLEKNLTQRQRQELAELLRKSKGRPSNLTAKQQERVRELVHKAALG